MIVPVDGLPPGMLFTLQVTLVLVLFVTVAAKVCEFPSRTDPLGGVTDTLIAGGGGGGGATEPEPPAAQPCIHTHIARAPRSSPKARAWLEWLDRQIIFTFTELGVRGRMQGRNAGEGPAKGVEEFSLAQVCRTRWASANYMKIERLFV